MKSDNLLRHLAIPFGLAVIIYVIFYVGIEHRRNRKGPWQVTFTNDVSGAASLVINQPALAITNLQITFPGETRRTNVSLAFRQAHEVPYGMPYGQCVFMDTTFLPGTIVLDLFGHEIQLIPRALTIDQKEIPWASGKTLVVSSTNSPPPH
jgi:hypothetical protein